MVHEDEINRPISLKILVAEDDETSTLLIKLVLKRYSHTLLVAQTGAEAVEMCRNNPDIDLVFMDMKMPIMDGYEATRQIRKFNKDIVIIALTAHALWGDREMTLNAGCNDYFTKPIDVDELKGLMQKYFS
jgi:CheY-like chemotaxis protein